MTKPIPVFVAEDGTVGTVSQAGIIRAQAFRKLVESEEYTIDLTGVRRAWIVDEETLREVARRVEHASNLTDHNPGHDVQEASDVLDDALALLNAITGGEG